MEEEPLHPQHWDTDAHAQSGSASKPAQVQRDVELTKEMEEVLAPKTWGAPMQRQQDGIAVPVQRDNNSGQASPGFRLRTPSLQWPGSPFLTGQQWGPDVQLRLDPEVIAMARAYVHRLLNPLDLQVAMRRTAAQEALATQPAVGPSTGEVEGTPSSPASPPGESTASPTVREGSVGDVLGAVAATEPVASMLESLQTQAEDHVLGLWGRASTGERIGMVSATALVGGAALASILAMPEARDRVLPMLNGRVIPVPGVTGLGVEVNFGEDSLMIGAHLDVGALLPSWMGFGSSSPSAIGGPPQPQTFVPGQRKAESRGGEVLNPAYSIAREIRAASSGGQALDNAAKNRLESGLKTNLSSVKVHTDQQADRLARGLNSRAFTTGNDIFFRSGQYNPASQEGMKLLAHEAAHTVQQARGLFRAKPGNDAVKISEPGDPEEHQADQFAETLVPSG
jgi:hypothetical protein